MKSQSEIKNVSVIFKTHLDIGFTDFAGQVERQYLENFIPAALTLAKETRGEAERFVWTTGSWLIHHFLEKAPRREKLRMEEAILNGDFHWHALPFTTHTELMDESLFALGLVFRDRLDARFGRKTSAAKMTDVPGHTRSMVPLLAKAGVRLLHIGVNPASTVPDVPPVFVWREGNSDLVVVYDKVYGATTALPGQRAVSVNLTNDNMGPPDRKEIADIYSDLRRRFPSAAILPGNLTEVADQLWKKREELPVVTSEIGDTWIHGLGTDPQKVAQFRTLSRLRREFIQEKSVEQGSDADLKSGHYLLLTAEHTWGMDVKTHLRDFRTYRRESLARSLKKPAYRKVAASWQEQRDYIDKAVAALPAVLKKRALSELALLVPGPGDTKGWRTVSNDAVFQLGDWKIRMDTTGGFIRFLEKGKKIVLPEAGRFHLGAMSYETFSAADYRRFYRQYNTLDVEWAQKDFTKTGLPSSARTGRFLPRLHNIRLSPSGTQALVSLVFEKKAQSQGAPREVTLLLEGKDLGLDMELQWFGKPANRMPEAFWMGFSPRLSRGASWTVEKLGRPVDLGDVVSKGARHLHASTGPVTAAEFSVESPEAVLVAPLEGKLLDFDNKLPANRKGIFFNLYNNKWNTNFPLWSSDDARFRFKLRWKGI